MWFYFLAIFVIMMNQNKTNSGQLLQLISNYDILTLCINYQNNLMIKYTSCLRDSQSSHKLIPDFLHDLIKNNYNVT